MTKNDRDNVVGSHTTTTQILLRCSNLGAMLAFTDRLGFRLDMIMPADAPRIAEVSGHGITLRLDASDGSPISETPFTLRLVDDHAQWAQFGTRTLHGPDGLRVDLIDRDAPLASPERTQTFVISHASDYRAWSAGRAGMQYRDLIPGRLGGRCIGSHIRISQGGEVPDYVHYHKVRFQMIFCKTGWVRVVYEDQGPPFVMHAGDCVLQPPGIRHRVLESSPGLEVIEIGCPAVHETWRDHALQLPTAQVRPQRAFDGQRFVRHIADTADWQPCGNADYEYRDTGIENASGGRASVRVLRAAADSPSHMDRRLSLTHEYELLFLLMLKGRGCLFHDAQAKHALDPDDACVIPARADYALELSADAHVLQVSVRAE